MFHTYCRVLGLSSNATLEDIRRAYKQEALKHHPDKNGGDDTRFKEINAAYQYLVTHEGLSKKEASQDEDMYKYIFAILNILYAKAQAQVQEQVNEAKETKQRIKPKTIVTKIKVRIEDVYNMRVLTCNVKVKRRRTDNQLAFESVTVYLPLMSYKEHYEFPECGDDGEHPDCPRGDICITTTIENNDNYYIDDLFCRYDIHTEQYISLYEYMYGIHRSLSYFNNEELDIHLPSILELRNNETTHIYIHQIPDKGLPYIEQDELHNTDIKRGSLFIHFKLHIPALSQETLILQDTQNIFKRYFNE
jgi:DnaJ-class molecular chaperone